MAVVLAVEDLERAPALALLVEFLREVFGVVAQLFAVALALVALVVDQLHFPHPFPERKSRSIRFLLSRFSFIFRQTQLSGGSPNKLSVS